MHTHHYKTKKWKPSHNDNQHKNPIPPKPNPAISLQKIQPKKPKKPKQNKNPKPTNDVKPSLAKVRTHNFY